MESGSDYAPWNFSQYGAELRSIQMSETNQAEFKGWARVEVMGHQSHTGYVTTEAYGAAVLFRIDQPEIPEVEEVLTESEWFGNTTLLVGTIVKRAKIEAVSVLVGAGSIYRIIPCTEEVARKAIQQNQRRPLIAVKLPGAKQLTAVEPISRDYSPGPNIAPGQSLEEFCDLYQEFS
jgi:hypothetical protein